MKRKRFHLTMAPDQRAELAALAESVGQPQTATVCAVLAAVVPALLGVEGERFLVLGGRVWSVSTKEMKPR